MRCSIRLTARISPDRPTSAAKHIFELTDQGDGTTVFVQREKFKGVLVPLFQKMLDTNTLEGFNAMNRALKLRSEGRL